MPRRSRSNAASGPGEEDGSYILDAQIGFVLRQAQQRHTALFAAEMIEGLTPTQWAALAKLRECGACSQNRLGGLTALDAATRRAARDRLTARGFTAARPDPVDARRLLVDLTEEGAALYERGVPIARAITEKTLEPLDGDERETLIALLRRLTCRAIAGPTEPWIAPIRQSARCVCIVTPRSPLYCL